MAPEIPYTLGLAFNSNLSKVLLIRKERGPKFNLGKWNGIGGKLERGEGIRGGMVREFQEETGIKTDPTQWNIFHTESFLAYETKDIEVPLNPRVYYLTTKLDDAVFNSYASPETEVVQAHYAGRIWLISTGYAYNLSYLVAMARCWHQHPERRWIEG